MCFQVEELAAEEIREVIIYTGNSADNGETINQALRNGFPLTSSQEKRLQIVEGAILKSKIIEERVLYRVIGQENTYCFQRGDMIIDKGVLEASLRPNIADTFQNRKYLLIISVPQNATCLHVTPYNGRSDEEGVLFPRNTKLLITKTIKKGIRYNINTIFCKLVL